MKSAWIMALLVAAGLAGCGDWEQVAPAVSGGPDLACRDLNAAKVSGDSRAVDQMLIAAQEPLGKADVDDVAVQRFYRGQVLKDLDYAFQYRLAIEQTCSESPRKSLVDASTTALNHLYQVAAKHPRWATCRFYTNGNITFDAVVTEMRNPDVLVLGGDQAASLAEEILAAPNYGRDYLQRALGQQCEQYADARLWAVLQRVGTVASREIFQQKTMALEAEHAAERTRLGIETLPENRLESAAERASQRQIDVDAARLEAAKNNMGEPGR